MKKILVVGAGFSGAVIARELAEKGFHVSVIDKRHHIAGNAYDYVNEHGIRVHKYGPHIFHTSNLKVVDWLSQYSKWIPYEHRVKALMEDGRYVTFPCNSDTLKVISKEKVLDVFYRPYTKKMWGLDLNELDSSIIQRVPIREDNEDRYFPKETFQKMPANGYSKLFENILNHKFIDLSLNTSFEQKMIDKYSHVFNSMAIDEFFDFRYGVLPYRSIKFHHFSLPMPSVLPVATVNFTHDKAYTRVTEWKKFPNHGVNDAITSITVEEPCSYEDNNYERYYPVKDLLGVNGSIYKKYQSECPSKITFIGRCGLYAYLDMHQAISNALSIVKKFIS